MDRIRDEAVRAVARFYGRRRKMLRPLAWSMLLLLAAVLGLLTAVFVSGGMPGRELASMGALLGPLTLLSVAFTAWTYRRGEARLVEALSHQPPRVRGASVSYLSTSDRPLLEIQTLDRRHWFVEIPAPLVHEVAAWLSRAASAAAQAGTGYRVGAPSDAATHATGLTPSGQHPSRKVMKARGPRR